MKKETPHKWVIEITQDMTTDEACELGRVLGSHGFTGHFHGGDIASLVRDGARWRKHMKGGEPDGELDKAVS